MRRTILLVAVGVLALLLVASALAGAAVRPQLALVAKPVFAVRGTHFKANERVRVAVTTHATWTRRGRTSPAGSFTAAVPAGERGRRDGLIVQATGPRGQKGGLKAP